jgi:hypothetical protein
VSGAWPWIAITLLGAYHGLDPSMGWLFAVALGLQEKRRGKVIAALFPIAAGHLISIALVVALIASVMTQAWWLLRPVGAVALILFGIFRLVWPRAHPRWVAMKVSAFDLVVWSFLMATAHGAGLMLFPVLLSMPSVPMCAPIMAHHQDAMPPIGHGAIGLAQATAVVILHTSAMFAVMGTIAIVVYQWLGLRILRSAWINLDAIWAGALIGAGMLSLVI